MNSPSSDMSPGGGKGGRRRGSFLGVARLLLAAGCVKVLLAGLVLMDFVPSPSVAGSAMESVPGPAEGEGQRSGEKGGPSSSDSSKGDIHPHVLSVILARERQVSDQEAGVAEREKALGLLEEEISGRMRELDALQKDLKGAAQEWTQRQEENFQHLVGVYSAMEPEKAAVLLEKMDEATVVRLFEGMKSKKVASVLALMEPEKAARISSRLTAQGRNPAAPAR